MMTTHDVIRTQKIGIMGVGNMGQAVLSAFIDSGIVPRENIIIANRSERKLKKVANEFQVRSVNTNEQLID